MTIGATSATPGTARTALSCSPDTSAPRDIPVAAFVPAPLTVICPAPKSRPPSHQAARLLRQRAEQHERRHADRDARPP